MSRHLERSRVILEMLVAEHIKIPEFESNEAERSVLAKKLRQLRDVIPKISASFCFIAPGLTTNVATTLCGVGACQELTQRFVLEYVLKYQDQNINLVFLGNSAFETRDNHVIVIIGSPVCQDSLYVGRGATPTALASQESFILIKQFFSEQKDDAVLVDPLLNVANNIHDDSEAFDAYCKKHGLTHVVSVRAYNTTPGFKESATDIKENAQFVAKQTTKAYENARVQFPSLFALRGIDDIVKKYKLPDSSRASLEKALRRAAGMNNIEDLKLLIAAEIDVDAKDSNPASQKTALHQAVLNESLACYDLLISAGADPTIVDATGKSALDYKSATDTLRL